MVSTGLQTSANSATNDLSAHVLGHSHDIKPEAHALRVQFTPTPPKELKKAAQAPKRPAPIGEGLRKMAESPHQTAQRFFKTSVGQGVEGAAQRIEEHVQDAQAFVQRRGTEVRELDAAASKVVARVQAARSQLPANGAAVAQPQSTGIRQAKFSARSTPLDDIGALNRKVESALEHPTTELGPTAGRAAVAAVVTPLIPAALLTVPVGLGLYSAISEKNAHKKGGLVVDMAMGVIVGRTARPIYRGRVANAVRAARVAGTAGTPLRATLLSAIERLDKSQLTSHVSAAALKAIEQSRSTDTQAMIGRLASAAGKIYKSDSAKSNDLGRLMVRALESGDVHALGLSEHWSKVALLYVYEAAYGRIQAITNARQALLPQLKEFALQREQGIVATPALEEDVVKYFQCTEQLKAWGPLFQKVMKLVEQAPHVQLQSRLEFEPRF